MTQTEPETTSDLLKHSLPTGAADIVNLGNGWCSFSLALDNNKPRQFLVCGKCYPSNYYVTSVLELK